MALPEVRIRATPGEIQVVIEDEDITSQLRSARIDLDAKAVPVVWLETMTGDLDFHGRAEVKVVALGSPAQEFLDRLSADELDRAVNERLQIQGGSYPELTLAVLRDWAAGT